MKNRILKAFIILFIGQFSSYSWAGCSQDVQTQCLVIENGKISEEMGCKVTSCGNVHSSFSDFTFDNDTHTFYNGYNADEDKSTSNINGQPSKYIKVDGISERFSCYQAISYKLILCGIER